MMMQSFIISKTITALYHESELSPQLISQARRYGAYEEDDDPYNSNREDYDAPGPTSRKQNRVMQKIQF